MSSNHFLAEQHQLDDEAVGSLTALGWCAPSHGPEAEPDEGSANFYADLQRTRADQLAVMTVRALRDVFGVIHPSFLTGDLDESGTGGDRPATEDGPEEALAVRPRGREHLRALVDEALVPVVGRIPEHDQDDDIPVSSGTGLVWVRVLPDAPAIHLFTILVQDVTDLDRAAFEVAVLNRDQRFFTFVLVEDAVMVHLYLPAFPFAPLHLRIMLGRLSEMRDSLDEDLAVRVGGRRPFEPSTEAEADEEADEEGDAEADADRGHRVDLLHPALVTILELELESLGSVDPVLAASICEMDRDLVLSLIAWSRRGEAGLRTDLALAAEAGESETEADRCRQELQRACRTTHLLRGALRVVVEDRASAQPGHAYDVPGAANRRGRASDVPLPGLDDGEQPLWDQ